MKKNIFIILMIVLLLALGAALYYLSLRRADAHELLLYGNVDVRQVNIAFRVPGKVAALHFEEGDRVAPSALMAVLDKTPYDSQLSKAQAAMEAIKPQLKHADILLKRREQAVALGGVTKEEVDMAVASRDELMAQLRLAEAEIAIAQDNLAFTEAYAPNEGIVLSRIREPGTVVNPADPIYTLSLVSPICIRAYANERQLGQIYYGMTGEVYTDSGHSYKGRIGFISPVAEFTPKTVETTELRTDLVYRLKLYVDHPDQFLKQGMPVTVRLNGAKDHSPSE